MSLPGNGIFVVQGEMAMLVTAMRRSTRWGSHSFPNEEYDVLMRTFQDLKTILNQVDDLRLLDPPTYLSPFLEVIRSKETTGPVTSLALSAIHKFLSYGLIDPTHSSVPATVEDIADAVTHARFVGTDHSSDGVVLMKILQVLRTLMLSPEGAMLTDESVCEIMLSCFRICFETRLTELLRRNAEQCLRDMTQQIFARVPQFGARDGARAADSAAAFAATTLSLKKRDKPTKKKLAAITGSGSLDRKSPTEQPNVSAAESGTDLDGNKPDTLRNIQDKNLINEAEITIEPVDAVKSPTKKHGRHSSMDLANSNPITQLLEKCVEPSKEENAEAGEENEKEESTSPLPDQLETELKPEEELESAEKEKENSEEPQDYVNHRGIRFTQEEVVNLQPYGLVCVRELFRFLISLCNPLDSQNTSAMVHLGLSLVGTALEVGADQIANYPSLLYLLKDPLARNLVTLLSTERISIFALDLQVSFLLFEALRFHLKLQMEAFFKKLIEIISTDTTKAIYELKEIHHLALESLSQMFRIPGLCAELYINYDCDIYCMNVFEELTKLLSKNVVSSTAYNIHVLSLEALMTIIEAIEMGSQANVKEIKEDVEIPNVDDEKEAKYGRAGHVSLELGGMDDVSVVSDHVTHDISQYFGGGRTGRHKPSTDIPSEAELDNIRNLKKWVQQGTELFNLKPEKGIEYLQEHGVLATPLDPHEVALFLRENPDLDKKMIGEFICKRSSRGEDDDGHSVLGAFAESFDFTGLRIDQALRLYLETFRLPGEAPLIFLVMERFAERWHTTNGEPFANTDAAFRLAYAVIMLNVDQHNHNAKKLNVPMTMEGFVRNLRGCNGSGDFDQAMLEAIFQAIKNEEMVMPAERVGPVRDAYLWRVLQRRGNTAGGRYKSVPICHPHHARLFANACPPTVTALSAAFERSAPPTTEEVESNNLRDSPALVALNGLERCAALISHLPPIDLTLDTLLLTLCKFTGLLSPQHANYIAIGVSLGQSAKAQLALRRACVVAARHADGVRDAWRHLLEIVHSLYIARLLPKSLVEAEDYLAPNGTVCLIRDSSRGADAGLLSSIYSYIALGESGVRAPTPHEKALIDAATECVMKCNLPGLLVTETKFLQLESLQELVRAMIAVGTPPDFDSLQLNPQLEDITIFFLELLGQTLIQNRDRLLTVWDEAGPHFHRCVLWAASRGGETLTRCLTALLRTCARLMRCAGCAPTVLAQLTVLFQLPYKLFLQQADVISCGLYELVKTSAQNVHTTAEWDTVLRLVCAAGAGAWPTHTHSHTHSQGAATTSSRSEGSEDESDRRPTSASSESELSHSPHTQGWILVKNEASSSSVCAGGEVDVWAVRLRPHRLSALARCCEALALVVRDVAHVTPYNCKAAVTAVRLFVAAATRSSKKPKGRKSRPSSARRRYDHSSDDEVDTSDQYHLVSIQLLDLMHTLHSRTAQIFKWWRDEDTTQGAEDYDLWEVAWKPLLQGIAQFCTDKRKQVANSAIAYLQRALLAPGLSAMGGGGWEACFQSVLFPLLEQLPRRADTAARANTIMCKVFLQHLSALSPRASFGALWLRVVEAQRALVAAAADDPLTEAALESLKNMILVMDSVRIFSSGDGYNDLWFITWNKIGEFLPNLKEELFPQVQDNARPPTSLPSHMQPSLPPSLPTLIPVESHSTSLLPIGPSPTNATPGHINPGLNQLNSLVNLQNSGVNQFNSGLNQQTHQIYPHSIQIRNTYNTPSNNAQQPILVQSEFQRPTHPNIGHSPVNISQTPPLPASTPSLVAPSPISGMVPIRNPLYDQAGLTSSVLLQPLNEMISTPIGISLQSQIPVLYPQTEPQAAVTETQTKQIAETKSSPMHHNADLIQPVSPLKCSILDLEEHKVDTKIEKTELYAEYLTNPYNESKDITKEAVLYEPEHKDQTVPDGVHNLPLSLLEKQKSLSENTTPMHKIKAQFGSSDNIKQESSIFNFSSYFGSNEIGGSEVFDTLMSTQDG